MGGACSRTRDWVAQTGLFSGPEASSRAISRNMALLLSARRHSTRHSLSTSRPTIQQIFSFSASKERLQ